MARRRLHSTHHLPSILNRHRAQLGFGSHRNRALQQDWNELGPEAFELKILDTLPASDQPAYDPADDLKVLEELWNLLRLKDQSAV